VNNCYRLARGVSFHANRLARLEGPALAAVQASRLVSCGKKVSESPVVKT